MKVVVTGSSGKLGAKVVELLVAQGHEVLAIDRVASTSHRPSWVCDLSDSGALFEAFAGATAVIHLAAIPAPNLTSDCATFNNNTAATYNVLKAAATLNIRKVVMASSIAAYGFLYARKMPMPAYLPLDEDHLCQPTDSYGLSKVVGETMAESFVLETGASVIGLRFPGVNFDPEYKLLKERLSNPRFRLPGFWTYVDMRDAAEACRLALDSDMAGHSIFNIAAPTSNMREPTDELLKRFLPNVKKQRKDLTGNWSGLDSRKAERLLGFRARYVWEKA